MTLRENAPVIGLSFKSTKVQFSVLSTSSYLKFCQLSRHRLELFFLAIAGTKPWNVLSKKLGIQLGKTQRADQKTETRSKPGTTSVLISSAQVHGHTAARPGWLFLCHWLALRPCPSPQVWQARRVSLRWHLSCCVLTLPRRGESLEGSPAQVKKKKKKVSRWDRLINGLSKNRF